MSSITSNAEYMLSIYRKAGAMLSEGFEAGRKAAVGVDGKVGFCGMGTSGFAGEIASSFFASDKSIGVSRYWEPPSPLGPGDLLVAVSYSGNTAETVDCALEAIKRGINVAVVTSGGRLGSLAKEKGLPAAVIPSGMPQRTTLPLMVGAVAGLFSESVKGLEGMVERASSTLANALPGWIGEVSAALGKAMFAVVAACGPLGVVARRWRTELAENAKMIARSEEYPESGHNDLVAFQAKAPEGLVAIVLDGPGPDRCIHIMRAVREIYEESGVPVYTVSIDADDVFAAVMRGVQLAGVVSVEAAVARGIDPLGTPVLERYRSLQERLSKR